MISKEFKISGKLLKQIMKNMTMIRNICAHNDRLFSFHSKFLLTFKDFDKNYIDTRRDLATQLFPKYDIIGFYSTNNTSVPAKEDTEILDTLRFFGIITPIYLILNTADLSGKLPITVYELDKTNKENTFRQLNYNIESLEAERICLDTVTKDANFGEDQSRLVQNLTIVKNAAGMLKENLDLIAELVKDPMDSLEALDLVGLKAKAKSYPHMLSGGQQQRVAIARAVALNPEIILFDEPTSALDPEMIGKVLDVIRDLASEGQTMVIVSHEMNFVRKISDRVVFMAEGAIEEIGTPDEFFDNPKTQRAQQFLAKVLQR